MEKMQMHLDELTEQFCPWDFGQQKYFWLMAAADGAKKVVWREIHENCRTWNGDGNGNDDENGNSHTLYTRMAIFNKAHRYQVYAQWNVQKVLHSATTVCGRRTFNVVLAKKYSYSFSYPTYRQVATIMRRQLVENCEWWKVGEKAMKMEPREERLFNVIAETFSLNYRHFCGSSKLIEYKRRIKKFIKVWFNLALIEKSAEWTKFSHRQWNGKLLMDDPIW